MLLIIHSITSAEIERTTTTDDSGKSFFGVCCFLFPALFISLLNFQKTNRDNGRVTEEEEKTQDVGLEEEKSIVEK